MQEQVIIIGNGIAGITAARHIRRISDKKITVISAESEYFFSRTALMYVFMGHMKWTNIEPYEADYWKKNRIELKQAYVQRVDTDQKILVLDDGTKMKFDTLIISSGSLPRKPGWKGESLPGVQSLVSKQDLELLEENSRNAHQAVVVGGGLIGIELAEMLHSRKIPVTMVIREKSFWRNVLPKQDADLVSRHIRSQGIEMVFQAEVAELSGNQRVSEVQLKDKPPIPADLVTIAVGVQPNIQFLKDSGIDTDKGILVDAYLRTNHEDIYAIGDCAQLKEAPPGHLSIEPIWYTARMMGETVAQTICGHPFPYRPGHWFNSAKFFQIEYQTYGHVSADPSESEAHYHWENTDGLKAITLAYHPENKRFLGINSFGIRLRHEVLDKWLTEKRSVQFVLEELAQADFDPEFTSRSFKEIHQTSVTSFS